MKAIKFFLINMMQVSVEKSHYGIVKCNKTNEFYVTTVV